MTPQQLLDRLREEMLEETENDTLSWTTDTLTVPQLMHIKAGLDRALMDAISDDETPCPHNGTRWTPEGSPFERCGVCGRVLQTEEV